VVFSKVDNRPALVITNLPIDGSFVELGTHREGSWGFHHSRALIGGYLKSSQWEGRGAGVGGGGMPMPMALALIYCALTLSSSQYIWCWEFLKKKYFNHFGKEEGFLGDGKGV